MSSTGLKPSATRLLRALREAERDGLTNVEIAQPDVAGLGYSARLAEVEEYLSANGLGHVERRRLTNSRWRYILIPRTPAAGVGAASPGETITAGGDGVDSGGPSEDSDRDQSTLPATTEHDPPREPSEPAARLFDPRKSHLRDAA